MKINHQNKINKRTLKKNHKMNLIKMKKNLILKKIFLYHQVLIIGKMKTQIKRMHQLFYKLQKDWHYKIMIGNKLRLKIYSSFFLHLHLQAHLYNKYKYMLVNMENKNWLKKMNLDLDKYSKRIMCNYFNLINQTKKIKR